jgi:catechol 2,3-dioxygenase-like lactoylglutathione lyase family enzyme
VRSRWQRTTWQGRCGFIACSGSRLHGGETAGFTSFQAGDNFLNLILQPAERTWSWWGRVIFYDPDIDALYARLVAAGCRPEAPPRDAAWGERFFHLTDPDGHEVSIAWPLPR